MNVYVKHCTIVCKSLKKHIRKKSGLALWNEELNSSIKLDIEKHWKTNVLHKRPVKSGSDSYYVLSMFPYPSGNLHMGHVRVYSISDTVARFYQMNGYNVLHPMGWDAFGLPAENAALERNINPHKWTEENIKKMKEQLLNLGFNFDWDREVTTSKPEYYHWTQYIFLKMLEKGLVYRKEALVNWDPVDQTVLADEQVDNEGFSWRSGAKVEKKLLNQWFVRTTRFANNLYEGLSDDTLDDWKDIVSMQKHWIGECNGTAILFYVKHDNEALNKINSLEVWSAEPEKFLQAKFIAISSTNVLNSEKFYKKVRASYKLLSVCAINPITDEELPIFVTDNVIYPEGRDNYLGCPSYSTTDNELGKEFGLENNVHPCCEPLSEQEILKLRHSVIKISREKGVGGDSVSSKLKDWLISRQRYWGTPIPIVHCEKCGTVPVPYTDLPVELPYLETLTKEGLSPLLQAETWLKCKCPKCGREASRETDTMDTFVDSSWYFLRYLDNHNTTAPFALEKAANIMPVNLYVGGKEHAVLHLYYARFMTHFLNSLGWLREREPFKKLLVQGMVMGKTYCIKSTGKYVSASEVEIISENLAKTSAGEIVEIKWEKMSKSKHNGVNPEDLINTYSRDTTRLFMLADVAPTSYRHWSDATFPGVLNWQNRLWTLIRDFINARNTTLVLQGDSILKSEKFRTDEEKLWDSKNFFSAAVTFNIKYTQQLSVAISRMHGLTNSLKRAPIENMVVGREYELALGTLLIMAAPFAPHFASELWTGFCSAPNRINEQSNLINWDLGVLEQAWPRVDDNYKLTLQCMVNGAERSKLKFFPKDLDQMTQDQALQLMLGEKSVSNRLKKGFVETTFECYPGCRAVLNIYTENSRREKKLEQVVS